MRVVAALCIFAGMLLVATEADGRCRNASLESTNITCKENSSIAFFWSDDLQSCVNRSVCAVTDDLFLSLDQCLKACSNNEGASQELHKGECA